LDFGRWSQRYSADRWIEALNLGIVDADLLQRIRESTRTGRPMGDADFVRRVEDETGRCLRPQKRGPKRQLVCSADTQPQQFPVA
jgi:hypothetical protein